jgi:hypothetical protein
MSQQRLDALAVTERTQKDGSTKTFFSRVGAAFPTKDGTGYTVILDSLPLSGKLLLKPPLPGRGGQDGPP